MAGINYTRLRKTARRLINRAGQDGIVRKMTNTGEEDAPVPTPSDTAVRLVSFDEVEKTVDGRRTGEVMKLLYVAISATSPVVPVRDDRVAIGVRTATDNTSFLEILTVETLGPGGTDVYYEVTVAG